MLVGTLWVSAGTASHPLQSSLFFCHFCTTLHYLVTTCGFVAVFDDGDEKTLRRTSLCLKGERHFAESEVRNRHALDVFVFRCKGVEVKGLSFPLILHRLWTNCLWLTRSTSALLSSERRLTEDGGLLKQCECVFVLFFISYARCSTLVPPPLGL